MVGLKKKSFWDKLKIENRMIAGYILFLLFLLMFVTIAGCNSGWSIAGWEVK
jgi:hypothetical protein